MLHYVHVVCTVYVIIIPHIIIIPPPYTPPPPTNPTPQHTDYGHLLAGIAQQFVLTHANLTGLALVLAVYGLVVTFAVKLNGMMLRIPMVYYKFRQGRVMWWCEGDGGGGVCFWVV